MHEKWPKRAGGGGGVGPSEKGERECEAGVKRTIEAALGVPHLHWLFTPLFTHCRPQLMPPGGWLVCPPRAPGPILSPYGCLIEHTALLIELTAPSLGPFSTKWRGLATAGQDPSAVAQKRGEKLQGQGRGACWSCEENVAHSVGKRRLEMWTGGNGRSWSSQQQPRGPKPPLPGHPQTAFSTDRNLQKSCRLL